MPPRTIPRQQTQGPRPHARPPPATVSASTSAAPSPTSSCSTPRAQRNPPAQMPDHAARPVRRRAGRPDRTAAAAGLTLADIGDIVHGTTLVTNALIERTRRPPRPDHHARASATSSRWAPSSATTSTTCSCNSPTRWCRAAIAWKCAERMDRDGNVLTPLDAGRRARRRAAPGRRRRRGDRRLLPARLPQPRARTRRPPRSSAPRSPISRSRSRPTWWPSCGSTSAASPPAPTPTCSR